MKNLLIKIGIKSRNASSYQIDEKKKNKVLENYFKMIEKNKLKIIKENQKDLIIAKKKGIKKVKEAGTPIKILFENVIVFSISLCSK